MTFPSGVYRIVNEIGESITYRRTTGTVYDEDTGENIPSDTDYTIKAHCKDYRPREINGDIQAGDRRVIIAGKDLAFTPEKADKVQIDGVWFEVVSVIRLTVRGSEAMFRLQVRQ